MSLFPAYAVDSLKDVEESSLSSLGEECPVSVAMESQLLASDEELPPAAKRARVSPPPEDRHFYLDTKSDYGNLRVSTLYYPGRPEYRACTRCGVLGAARRAGAGAGPAPPRYWQARPPPPAPLAAAAAARAADLRRELAVAPHDEDLWLRYIDFQAEWGAPGAAVAAAREARARADTRRVRAALHRARALHLPRDQLAAALRADAAAGGGPAARADAWARLLEAAGPGAPAALADAALASSGAGPAAYPRLLYVHGCVLRAAGLWERLVLTVELVAAMNYPPAPGFPPRPAPGVLRAREEAAQRREDQACDSGLPLSAVWARVERVRAAARWRPAGAGQAGADPQRAPAAAEAAAWARAGAGGLPLLCALVRLARVPLLPASEAGARAAGAEPRAGASAAPETLAGALRAARRLPAAHAARAAPAAARAALAPLLDPPHCFSDADGYLSWTSALWEACCGWAEGRSRLALVCWRLRWLHALALLAEPGEARRLRGEARALVRERAPHAAAAALCARAATRALRAALRDPAAPHAHLLFAARVLAELAEPPAARWARCCAVLRRALPADAELLRDPPPRLLQEARARCDAECARLEQGFEDAAEEEEEGDLCAALLPGAGEWAGARVALTPPHEHARLLSALLATAPRGASLPYREQAACALTLAERGAARVVAARALLPLFPRNALLALVCSGAGVSAGAGPPPPPSSRAALALLVPQWLRAPLAEHTDPAEARRVCGACARACARGAGGAVVRALRLEAEARAPRPRTRHALLAALADLPDHKWLYVRGAAWSAADAGSMCDALLERGLRVHTLLEELPAAPPAGSDAPTD